MRWSIMFMIWATATSADSVAAVSATAQDAFAEMPRVVTVDRIEGNCGADAAVNPMVAYCTTSREIFLAEPFRDVPFAAYLVAHAYGHAVQVRHGVADVALRKIRARPAEETMLRGLVERQVDCIAGFLITRAGLPETDLRDFFTEDPFPDVHWGRNPLRVGPVISVDLEARNAWLQVGQAGDLAACAPGEFSSDLLVVALRD